MESAYSQLNLLITLAGIAGSGVSAYIGVKVALVQIKTRQDNHDKDIEKLDRRLTYVERHLFKHGSGNDD